MAEQQITFKPVILRASGPSFADLPTKESLQQAQQGGGGSALYELLLVGGGGGGAEYSGAGGGAGGLVYTNSFGVTANSVYNITVGTGGAAGPDVVNDASGYGQDGISTTLSKDGTEVYVASGGGGGGGVIAAGRTGGSSGGDGRYHQDATPTAISQQLYNGIGFGNVGGLSAGVVGSNTSGGGGGGAGSAGGNASVGVGGVGGDGKSIDITGSSVYYAAGGPGKGYNSILGNYGLGGSTTPGGGGRGGEYQGSRVSEAGNDGLAIIASTVEATNVTGAYTLDTASRSGYFVYTFTGDGTIAFPANSSGNTGGSTGGTTGGDTGGTTPPPPATSSTDITFETDAYLTSPSTNTFSYTRAASTYTNGSSSSAPLRSDGKYYFEVDVTSLSRTAVFIGLGLYGVDGGEVTTDFKWLYGHNGNIFPPNAGYLGAGFVAGSTTLMFAYDALTREVWFGANGTWGQDPTSASSYTIGGSSGDNVALIFGSGTSRSLTFQGTVKLDADLTYTVPTGFSSH
jgi:hypothetical protein